MQHKLSYFARNFVIGLAFFVVLYFGLYQVMAKGNQQGATKFLYVIVANTICYPFAKAVYDEIASFVMQDRIVIYPILIAIVIRFVVFWFALFIAPFYVLFFMPKVLNYIKNRIS